jgi:hypothetical protein
VCDNCWLSCCCCCRRCRCSSSLLLLLLLQGEFVDKLADLIMKTYGASNSIAKGDIYFIQDKKKQQYYDEDSDE